MAFPRHTVYTTACIRARVSPCTCMYVTRDSGCTVHAAATARTALRFSFSRSPIALCLCRLFWSGIYARFDGKRQRNSDATQDNFWFTASSPELSPAVHRAEIRPAPHFRNGNPPPPPRPPLPSSLLESAVAIAFQQRSFDGTRKGKKKRERCVCSEIGCDRES